ncbi:MAG: hypothetical protein GX131_19660 [candidate division WS1 bacterium]|jgi:uncharacterized protein YkwD|nr:hypothetical protein [candidate division WS1 bacterium]
MTRKRLFLTTVVSLLAILVTLSLPASAATSDDARKMLADASKLIGRGDQAAALTKIEAVTTIAPQWPAAYATLGTLYQRIGQQDLALESFTRFQHNSLLNAGAEDGRLTREIAEGEALMILLVNEERAKRDVPALVPDEELSAISRRHSQEMCEMNYFAHESPTRSLRTPSDRFKAHFGFDPLCLGENLARMSSRPLWSYNMDNLRDSHQRLMESDGHRKAILWEIPRSIGVGIAVNDSGDYWVTENFAILGR